MEEAIQVIMFVLEALPTPTLREGPTKINP
jgi:hypothetical protein